jgi:thermitase
LKYKVKKFGINVATLLWFYVFLYKYAWRHKMIKKIFPALILILISFSLFSETLTSLPKLGEKIKLNGFDYDTFYFVNGEPQYLLQKYDRISIPHSVDMVSIRNLELNGVLIANLIKEVTDIHGTVKAHRLEIPEDHRTAWINIRDRLADLNIPAWPVVTYHAKDPLILDGKMNIHFSKWTSLKERFEVFEKYDLDVVEISDQDPEFYTVALPIGSDPFQIANDLVTKGYVRWAQPNWYWHLELKATTPNDPYYSSQWHLPQIMAHHAWDTETGAGKNVKIAIVDSGVDTTHPDLNVLAGYDYIDKDSDPNPKTNDDAHGTAVAGLATARTDNNLGVAGVCWGCPIIPIRLIGGWGVYPSTIKDALQYAVDQGAWVINNSWGPQDKNQAGQCVSVPADSNQAQAVTYARINGRSGKGSIMLWAAGNSACNTNLQASLKNDDLLAISALEKSGALASYSNYGWEIDLSAGAGTHTTDTQGSAGYNTGGYGSYDNFHDLDYMSIFSGTSAASPVAAGAVALMIAANPDLTFSGIMNCAKASAAKTSTNCSRGSWVSKTDPYLESGSKDHSPCFGFGVVDTNAMVNGAKDGTCGACVPTSDIDLCFGDGYDRDDNCDGTVDTDCDKGGVGRAADPCTKDDDCLNTATDPKCITDWKGGYCSAQCTKNTDCYNGNSSVECYQNQCIAKCSYNEVRSGYDCISNKILPEGTEVTASCGNDIKEPGEECDGGTKPCTTIHSTYTGGYARCLDDCTGWNTSTCESDEDNLCGNGIKDPDEICDGNVTDCKNLAGAKPNGVASCLPDCSGWDKSKCSDDPSDNGGDNTGGGDNNSGAVCGNGVLELGEQCDDGNLIPGDGCDENCRLESKKSSGGCSVLHL